MLKYDHHKRISPDAALQDPFLLQTANESTDTVQLGTSVFYVL